MAGWRSSSTSRRLWRRMVIAAGLVLAAEVMWMGLGHSSGVKDLLVPTNPSPPSGPPGLHRHLVSRAKEFDPDTAAAGPDPDARVLAEDRPQPASTVGAGPEAGRELQPVPPQTLLYLGTFEAPPRPARLRPHPGSSAATGASSHAGRVPPTTTTTAPPTTTTTTTTTVPPDHPTTTTTVPPDYHDDDHSSAHDDYNNHAAHHDHDVTTVPPTTTTTATGRCHHHDLGIDRLKSWADKAGVLRRGPRPGGEGEPA